MADQEGSEPMVEQDNVDKKPKKKSRFLKLKPRKVRKRVKKVIWCWMWKNSLFNINCQNQYGVQIIAPHVSSIPSFLQVYYFLFGIKLIIKRSVCSAWTPITCTYYMISEWLLICASVNFFYHFHASIMW